MTDTTAKLDMSLDEIAKTNDRREQKGRGPRNNNNNNRGGNYGKERRERKGNRVDSSSPYRNEEETDGNNNDQRGQRRPRRNYNNPSDVPASARILKVSAQSNIKTVAGSIAYATRLGDAPTLISTGVASINQTIKSVALSRRFLEDNKVDVTVLPVSRSDDRLAMSFVLNKTVLRPQSEEVQYSELRVAAESEHAVVAGAIANKIRAGERVSVVAIGPGSVTTTARALALSRRFLQQDHIDITFRPEFVQIEMKDGSRSGIRFIVLAQQV